MSECEYNEIIINPPEQPVDTEYVPAPSEPGSRGQALLSDGEDGTYWGNVGGGGSADDYVTTTAEIRLDTTGIEYSVVEGANSVSNVPVSKIVLANPKTGKPFTIDDATDLTYEDIFAQYHRTRSIPVIDYMNGSASYQDHWIYSKMSYAADIKKDDTNANTRSKASLRFFVIFAPNYEEIDPNETRAEALSHMTIPGGFYATVVVKRSLFD